MEKSHVFSEKMQQGKGLEHRGLNSLLEVTMTTLPVFKIVELLEDLSLTTIKH